MKKKVSSIVRRVAHKVKKKPKLPVDGHALHRFHNDIENIKKEMSKIVVGQKNVVDSILRAIISNGHVLLEGVPGIAKTLIMRSLAHITSCKTKRVQFTADLLPTDIIGLTSYEKSKGFFVIKGPIFTNFMLADEINRAPAKVQSALLEAMQEKQVTIGRQTFGIDAPFFVLATQNPIETMGTYALPEAQIDRFLFKLYIDYPNTKEEREILLRNITTKNFSEYDLRSVIGPLEIIKMQHTVKNIFVSKAVEEYIVRLVDATRHPEKYNLKHSKYIRFGSSPRASIGLYVASKANALMKGKEYVTPQHVKEIAYDVLRHRILLNYEGQAENIDRDDIIKEVLARVPIP
ncbi:MAG: ATPase [Nanoarchaeota archaeon]|nr:ATPase [Nanoarchaeota archaeon]